MEPPRAYSNNSGHLLIFIIVRLGLGGAGAFSRDFTTKLPPQCRAFSGALKIGKLKAPKFLGPKGPRIQMTGALVSRTVLSLERRLKARILMSLVIKQRKYIRAQLERLQGLCNFSIKSQNG